MTESKIETTAWDGRPVNPERDGWHWLKAGDSPFLARYTWDAYSNAGSWREALHGEPLRAERFGYAGPVALPGENSPIDEAAPLADTDRLTCRDPDLDLDALERAHARVLTMYRSCVVGGASSVAAEWQALLVASGYGWPASRSMHGEISPADSLGDAALALAQANVPPDVQALLIEGDGRGNVAPGALSRAVHAAVKVALSDAAYAVLLVHNARIARGNAGFTSQAMMECQDAIKRIAA